MTDCQPFMPEPGRSAGTLREQEGLGAEVPLTLLFWLEASWSEMEDSYCTAKGSKNKYSASIFCQTQFGKTFLALGCGATIFSGS